MSNAKTEPPIQDQLAKLDELLAWFDQPEIDLDQAIKKFDTGVELAEAIKKRLEHMEHTITILKKRFD